jgi:charged multivesicular body protein 1
MEQAMKTMNLEQIAQWMDKFEKQFDDMDVQSSYTENAMADTTTTAIPVTDVNALMQNVADEAGYGQVPFFYRTGRYSY